MLFIGFFVFALAFTIAILDFVGISSGAGALLNLVMGFGLVLLAVGAARLGHHHLFGRHRLSH